MIEVVFNESLKGSLRYAKSHQQEKNDSFGSDINDDGTLRKNSQDIVCIGYIFDIGDISGEIYGEERKHEFAQLYQSIEFESEEIDSHFLSQRRDLDLLIAAAKNGEKIRIWKSNSPHSICAYAFLCNALNYIECEISILSLPDFWITPENEIQILNDWAEVPPEQLHTYLPLSQELLEIEKNIQSELWNTLKHENKKLRIFLNGSVISVNEDFYDSIITQYIPNNDFMMAKLIGTIMGNCQVGVGDGWYAYRINKMIDEGTLMVISDNDPSHRYGKILRKTKRLNL